jgi:hypothetical protein
MLSLPFLLLIAFVLAALGYGVATRRLVKLDKRRLQLEPPPLPDPVLGAATDFARRMGLTLAPGSDELKDFCTRHGLAREYRIANAMLYVSILVGFAVVIVMIRSGGRTA